MSCTVIRRTITRLANAAGNNCTNLELLRDLPNIVRLTAKAQSGGPGGDL